MTSWKPPIRIEPYPSESLGGFLIRYCDTNAWPTLTHFAKLLGVDVRATRFQEGDLAVLEANLGLPAGTLPWEGSRRGTHEVALGGQSLKFVHFHKHRRVCRTCLKESGYARSYWDLRFISHCHLHRQELDHQCGCGKDLSWIDPSLAQCRTCLVDEAPLPKTSPSGQHWPFQQWCLSRLCIGQFPDSVPELDAMPLAMALRFVENVGRLEVGGYVYSTHAEPPVSMFDVREAGFMAIREKRIGVLFARIVSDFRAATGIVCPDPARDALGWFGTVLLYEVGAGQPDLVKTMLDALSDALGYPVLDIDKSCYVTVAQTAAIHRVPRSSVMKALEKLEVSPVLVGVGGDLAVPDKVVFEVGKTLRGK